MHFGFVQCPELVEGSGAFYPVLKAGSWRRRRIKGFRLKGGSLDPLFFRCWVPTSNPWYNGLQPKGVKLPGLAHRRELAGHLPANDENL
jgi:hypothetical protein